MKIRFPFPVKTDGMPVLMMLADHPSRYCRAIILVTLALFLIPQGVPAHPPSDMVLAFDQGDRVLSVTITHMVADPLTHYVKRVLITTGGSVISDNAYTSQPSPQTFTYTYLLPEGGNGEVEVRAECSIFGSITRSLQVQGASPEVTAAPASPGTTPGETATRSGVTPPAPAATPPGAGPGLLPIGAAIALAAWRFRR